MKYTIRPFRYGPYDYRDAEILLNKMSQKGWAFKTTSKGWIKNWAMFERAKDENPSTYNIDLKGTMDDREMGEYCRFYEDLGWHHLDTYNKKLNIFKSNRKNAIPIYSEDQAEYENIKTFGDSSIDLPYIMQFIGMAVLFYVLFKSIRIDFNLVTYSFMVVLSMLMIDAAIMVFLNILYRRDCKKSMKKTGQLPKNMLLRKWRIWEIYGENFLILLMGFGTIFGLGYEIWGDSLIFRNDVWPIGKEIYFGMALVGFVGMFFVNFIYMIKPEKKSLRIVDFIFDFSWFFASITYLQMMSGRV